MTSLDSILIESALRLDVRCCISVNIVSAVYSLLSKLDSLS